MSHKAKMKCTKVDFFCEKCTKRVAKMVKSTYLRPLSRNFLGCLKERAFWMYSTRTHLRWFVLLTTKRFYVPVYWPVAVPFLIIMINLWIFMLIINMKDHKLNTHLIMNDVRKSQLFDFSYIPRTSDKFLSKNLKFSLA